MDQFDELPIDRRTVQMKMDGVIPFAAQSLPKRIDRLAFARASEFECTFHRGDLSRHHIALRGIATSREH
ncbi:hypothetical protein SPHN_06875 [Sphingomonas faeni]|nr:hypothetical protein [Sphingomonas faeni]